MLTKMKLGLAVCGALVAGGVGLAAAQGHAGGKAGMMQKYDKNGDGTLDASEKAALRADREAKKAERLAKFDTNKDGKLDDSERAVMKSERAEAAFKKLDADGNGQISLDEFKAGKMHARGGHGGFRHRKHRGADQP
jgi:hypothetical protein